MEQTRGYHCEKRLVNACRPYMLYKLKRAGITQKALGSVYVSVVRPVPVYACPVRHTNLQKLLSITWILPFQCGFSSSTIDQLRHQYI